MFICLLRTSYHLFIFVLHGCKNTEMLTRILKWHTKILNSGWRLCSDYIKAIFCIFSTHVKILRLKWPACYSHPAGKLWVEPIFLSHFMQSENKFKWEWFLPLIHTPTSLQPLISHPKKPLYKIWRFCPLCNDSMHDFLPLRAFNHYCPPCCDLGVVLGGLFDEVRRSFECCQCCLRATFY